MDFQSGDNSKYWIVSKSHGSNPSFDAAKKTITVEPGCYAVVSTRNVSGIGKVAMEPDAIFNIWGGDGCITLSGVGRSVEIYTLQGVRVARVQEDSTVSVPAGVYVARAGNKAIKVLVR